MTRFLSNRCNPLQVCMDEEEIFVYDLVYSQNNKGIYLQ